MPSAQVCQSTGHHTHKYASLQYTTCTSMPVSQSKGSSPSELCGHVGRPHQQWMHGANKSQTAQHCAYSVPIMKDTLRCSDRTAPYQAVFAGRRWERHPVRTADGFGFPARKKTQKQVNPPSQSSLFEGSIMHSKPCKLLVFTNHGKERTWPFTELMHTHSKIKYCCTHRLAAWTPLLKATTAWYVISPQMNFPTRFKQSIKGIAKNPSSSGHFRLGHSALCKLDCIHLSPPANWDSIHNSQWPIRTQLPWQDMAGCPLVVAEHWLG